MSAEKLDAKKRAEMLYNYKLYSYRQLRTFSKYAWRTAKEVSDSYGGSRFAFWMDMMWCNLRYGAMHNRDYTLFELYRKSGRERDSFMTFRRFYRMIKHLDKNTFFSLIDKATMYNNYAEFIKRDWIVADENSSKDDVIEFINSHNRVLVKPVSSEQGSGIYEVTKAENYGIEKVLQDRLKGVLLLEELCENCEELNAINSSSLNTLRIYTIVNKNNEVEILSTSLRCGCGDSIVDNWGSGGVGYLVDQETGVIVSPGLDKKGKKYIIHPGTNIVMPGIKIPRFNEACQLAKKIIEVNKKVVFAGLDFGILSDRVELIEVNFPGGHDFLQVLDMMGKNHCFKHILNKN